MASPLVDTLSAPIRQVQALVGPGWSGDPGGDPAQVLGGIRDSLADVAAAADRAWRDAGAAWTGSGADAAEAVVSSTSRAIDGAADRAGRLGVTARDAAAAVGRAHARLRDIVEGFEAKAAALEPHLDSPGVARELLAAARDALADAVAVVEELRAELDRHATGIDAPAPAPTSTAGWSATGSSGVPAAGLGGGPAGFGGVSPASFGGGPGGFGATGSGGTVPAGLIGGLADLAETGPPVETPDAATFGEGLAIQLPDGTVVTAPNPVAAGAVRSALTQLGVPYQWGGTSPGVGLDCSGLTQWAYHQAGLDLPRLAQEQDIGAAVAPGSLLPGDLAVWDGHVAMVVGDGTMIEAGDPVQLSPIRTSNAGQGFQGFWRPTA